MKGPGKKQDQPSLKAQSQEQRKVAIKRNNEEISKGNFDARSARFQRNIYESAKGKIRLAVLDRDFEEHVFPEVSVGNASVFDAGAGQGQFALSLAKRGAQLTMCDISAEMLREAERNFTQAGVSPESFTILNQEFQLAIKENEISYDIVLCHALAEWLERPEDIFSLLEMLKVGGYFSVIFYNISGLEFKNLLRTNFKRFDREKFKAYRGSLTPTNPIDPEVFLDRAQHYPLDIMTISGIRVFHDYIFNRADREREPLTLLEKELEYSQRDPYWRLGRYIHVLFRKTVC